ncbi:GspE/PulE family protein [Pseudemcibacter aquimaris]|uniref:GspE/PulE family protein n=1 Tax=Pseudemcibacter aquimaris TaxID=2857064 RepID=UPI002011769F|nr:ATPase, T2SS/T4P/T4SS family [Pseudemcibacter aquimaris]MCC3861761.1 Flp pilus assembly complex ATPase component TadA [Pseudemcibacter aquimaris]WDU58527.1 Flp pilus assembly complex ATPase component TadA [Pseudemcibacter aquimaris]
MMGKNNIPVESYRDPHLLPYSFAKANSILIAEDDLGRILCLGPEVNRDMIPEVMRVFSGIQETRNFEEKEFGELLSVIFSNLILEEEIEQSSDDDQEDLDAILEGVEKSADLLAGDDDAPVIRLLNSLLSESVRSGASDIHLEPYENEVIARLRIDGVLKELATFSAKLAPYLVSRIKVMARLDIADKRTPQDGRLSLTLGDKVYDVRVSTLPTRFGERVVMRLLDTETALIELSDLGLDSGTLGRFENVLKEPNGIVLVTGPTGSGKTTTLYASIALLNDQTRNIMTVEDPVEYAVPGISQTQVNSKVGMTFASGLRSILRQDPDIVMVGEIRDMETAEMAVQASLTGHLVLSTVHTNSAVSAISRLLDMGVERYLLSSSIKGILAQRLVRKLCSSCKTEIQPTPAFLSQMGVEKSDAKMACQAVGCQDCNNTGYRGRTAIYELIIITEEIKTLIHEGASEQQIEKLAFKEAPRLADSGRDLILSGITTMEEVLRVSNLREDYNASL